MHGIILTGRLKKSIFWAIYGGKLQIGPAYNEAGKFSDYVMAFMEYYYLTERMFIDLLFIGTPIAYYMRNDVVRMLKVDAPHMVQNEPDQYIKEIISE